MRQKKARRSGNALCLGIAVVVMLCAGSAQDVPQQPRLQYDVSVTLKLIQVYVTDKSGKPVRDLAKEDFVVFDGGKPVTLTDFEKHDLGIASPETGAAAKEEPSAPPPAASRDVGRKFILFFDFAFNNPKGVTVGVKAALNFLDTAVSEGDEAALLSYSMMKGLKVHEFLTTDIAKVRKAVSVVTAKETAGRADEFEQAYWRSVEMAQLLGEREARIELSRLDMDRQDSIRQAQNYFLGLTALARAMRLVQGRKNILFFSTGVPSTLGHSSRMYKSSGTQVRIEIGDSVLPGLQEAMLKEFSASECSFYAFDTRESAKIADLFWIDQSPMLSTMFSKLGVHQDQTNLFRDDKTTGMDTLKRLSKQTGGQYYSNIRLYEKNMDRVRDITGTYYVLGYPASTARDGAFHDIKVKVKKKGLRVRTQAGYFNPKPFREYTDLEKRLDLLDLALNERSNVRVPAPVSISALSYDAGGGTRLRAVARVPKDALGGFQGKTAEFVALFFNEEGNLLSLQRAELELSRYRGNDIVLTAGTPVRSGRAKCRVILRDLDTGQSVLGSADAYIGDPAAGGLRLYSPMLLVRSSGAALVDGVIQGTPESPAWREVYAYDPALFTPVVGGDPIAGEALVVAVPFSVSGLSKPDLVFKVNLVDSTTGGNTAVPFTPTSRGRLGGVEVLHLEIPAGSWPVGKYLLYIHAGDKSSGAVASTYVPLAVNFKRPPQ
ncbi:MAG: VWA domain-containing protein [Acidobacteria bacterium]|nr:VWA domain-containing protein [Acidobacteriota bacterium]